jgi:phosphoglycerol transferase
VTGSITHESVRTGFSSKQTILTWILPCFAAALSLTIGWYVAGGKHVTLHIPLLYSSDGLFSLMLIKRIMENPWVFDSSALGYPFGASLYDYPIPDSGSLAVLKVMALAMGSASAAYNIYYLIGFPLNALAAYYARTKLHVSQIFRVVGAIIFSILPFHFLRLEHLFYTWYFAAPIFVAYAIQIYSGDLSIALSRHQLTRQAGPVIALVILSCFGVYYSLFGVILLLTAGVLGSVRAGSRTAIHTSIIMSAVILIGVAANISPNIANRIAHGANQEATHRQAAESEVYGLKVAQLLLPRPDHRFQYFSKINSEYSSSFPLVNENRSAAEGFIASAGLIILFFSLIRPRKGPNESDTLFILSSLTFVLIIFCTVGGLSSLFSLLISPMIRAWNRASVFIAFMSLGASMLTMDRIAQSWRGRTLASFAIAVGTLAFAVWDQTTPPCIRCLSSTKADFENDARFISSIEKTLPRGSAVYQLPYMAFPEVPPLHRLQSYDQARGYIHSLALKWSYGAMKGSAGDLFFRALAQQPLQRQLDVAARLGFQGLYVDRRGYADNGADIEQVLVRALGKKPAIISANGEQLFFDLRSSDMPQSHPLPPGLTEQQIMKQAGFAADKLGARYTATFLEGVDFSRPDVPDFVSDLEGVSAPESWGRWSDANAYPYVKLSFVGELPKRFVLHIRAQAFGPNAGRPVTVTIGSHTTSFVPGPSMEEFSLRVDNGSGANTIEIHPAQPTSPSELGMSADSRKLGIGLHRLWIEAIHND